MIPGIRWLRRACGSLALLLLLGPGAARAETALEKAPAFDHEGVPATWVITLPPGHDAKKPYPLILDFHGAIAPSRQGAVVTKKALWSKFVERVPCIVVGLNGRTRAWGMIKGKTDDIAFARHVLREVRKRYAVDEKRIYLAGFSSGSDFLCKSGIRKDRTFAASLPVCPGPPNVVGLRGGVLLAAKDRPILFATGEEDYVRKSGAWEAFLALDAAGAPVRYREVPGKAHEFLGLDEYVRLFADLEGMAHPDRRPDPLTAARQALRRGDLLLASSLLARMKSKAAGELMAAVEKRGADLVAAAKAVSVKKEPGRAYEAWWRVMTQLHQFPQLAAEGRTGMAAIEKTMPRRELYRARRDWFRRRTK